MGCQGLDDFMWTEIMCRVSSTKYFFRCKCVSKHWNSLISNQHFIRRFIDHHREKYGTDFNTELVLFLHYITLKDEFRVGVLASSGDGAATKQGIFLPWGDKEETKQPSSPIFSQPIYEVKNAFHDLLVCSETRSLTYYIVNPFTKERVELPLYDPDGPYHSSLHRTVGFVCEPFYRHDRRQVDPVANYRYRVVRNIYLDSFGDCRIEMYRSEIKQWSLLTGLDRSKYGCRSNIVAHGGKLYWYNFRDEVVAYNPFGASDELDFDFLGLDKTQPWSRSRNFQMAESQGSLLLMQLTDKEDSYLSIWKLDEEAEYGDRVAFRFERTVVTNRMISDTCPSFIRRVVDDGPNPLVLGVHPSNQDVIFLGSNESPCVASYNLGTKEWRVVGEIQHINDDLKFIFRMFGVTANLPWWPTPVH